MKEHIRNHVIQKSITMSIAVLFALITLTVGTPISASDNYSIILDGQKYDGTSFIESDIAYISLREFACTVDNSVVSWDDESMTSTVTTDSLTLYATDGNDYIEANGRILWCKEGVFTRDGVLYVPLKQAARAFGFDSSYDSASHSTTLTRKRGSIISADDFYDEDDLYWLSQIIHAESQGEPFLGKLAVGTVILNRVDSDDFPDTIYDVIFDNKNGVQFTPTANGAIEKPAGDDSIKAAKICLEDTRLSDEILYFLNEAIATNFWIVENCRYVLSIGDHNFYAP